VLFKINSLHMKLDMRSWLQ